MDSTALHQPLISLGVIMKDGKDRRKAKVNHPFKPTIVKKKWNQSQIELDEADKMTDFDKNVEELQRKPIIKPKKVKR